MELLNSSYPLISIFQMSRFGIYYVTKWSMFYPINKRIQFIHFEMSKYNFRNFTMKLS